MPDFASLSAPGLGLQLLMRMVCRLNKPCNQGLQIKKPCAMALEPIFHGVSIPAWVARRYYRRP